MDSEEELRVNEMGERFRESIWRQKTIIDRQTQQLIDIREQLQVPRHRKMTRFEREVLRILDRRAE